MPASRKSICLLAAAAALLACLPACGYHTVGSSSALPPTLHTIAIPAFENRTHTYRLEQIMTAAVLREMATRTHYRIEQHDDPNADAVLHGTVVSATSAPLTYDRQTGRASSIEVTVVAAVKLVARDGRVLYQNDNYVFRDQYEVSREITSFFEEESPALGRMAGDFSRTLVSNLLEAY